MTNTATQNNHDLQVGRAEEARRFAYDLMLLIGVGLAVTVLTRFVIYPMFGIGPGAPQPARTIILVGVLLWMMKKNDKPWTDLGLIRFKPLWLLPVLVFVFLAAQNFVAQPMGDLLRDALKVAPSDTSFLTHIHGNPAALVFWIPVAWIAAGLGEEILFRGFFLNRVGQLLNGGVFGWSAAILVQAVIFGLGHAYLGFGGSITIAANRPEMTPIASPKIVLRLIPPMAPQSAVVPTTIAP